MIGILSAGIARIPHLASFLGEEVRLVKRVFGVKPDLLSSIAGWGQRPSTKGSRVFANRHGLPFISLEDGFLRSSGLGVHGDQPLSLVVDDLGIYYDATNVSRLETLIGSVVMNEELKEQAVRAMDQIRHHRLSKYNHAPERLLPPLSAGTKARVLVLDQTQGDVSVTLGGADSHVFRAMLAAAISENPDAEIWVKTHPDVVSGKKQGYLGSVPANERVHLLADDISPLFLVEQVDKVYVVTSQMGFEALLLHKPVVCFGMPWYAGWGLTDDRHPNMRVLHERRNVSRSLQELFAAAYMQYARYIDPSNGQPGTIFDVITWLARNKAANSRTHGVLYCVGMSLWKRAIVRPFLATQSARIRFVRSVKALQSIQFPADTKIVIWGVKNDDAVRAIAMERGVPLWRMEDGFLRSVGLGSDLHRPVSLVLDQGGIYYDPNSDSDLQRLLESQVLTKEELDRTAAFRKRFVAMRASKYNVGHGVLEVNGNGRRVILVPGQVEDDASIKLGSPLVSTNLDLLSAVRAANSTAYIIYKPHPDVVAGNRKGAVEKADLDRLTDQVVMHVNIIDCILASDEVHTMTSLSGFEALLHGRVVHCYGGPFYAGWGLTQDHYPLPHRTRRVSLDELVFATLLEYPRYALPGVRGLASAEQVLDKLVSDSERAKRQLYRQGIGGWISRKVRKAKALMEMMMERQGYTPV